MSRRAKPAAVPPAVSLADVAPREVTPAEDEFAHLLRFATLDEAEATLRRLDALWREFSAPGGPEALGRAARVLDIARQGLRRAQMIAGNRRVSAAKRAEKQEIRQWFRVWLETPDAFFDWLELRKESPEFVQEFGGGPSSTRSDPDTNPTE
jgi:hypothetical protein